jgi:uncharacterized protein with HEPN domain
MPEQRGLDRIEAIKKRITFIENIVEKYGSIDAALSDEENGRAAILMHLTSMAEQFDKLMKNGEYELLAYFDKEDIKGSYDLRNFIAHEYEGVDLYIVEGVIRERLPVIKGNIEQIEREGCATRMQNANDQ